MGLVSKSIPNLINGVSQQPPSLRLDSQGEVQENGFSDVVDGLKKRPPTSFIKKLCRPDNSYTISQNLYHGNTEPLTVNEINSAYFHTYKRSDTEVFTVVVSSLSSTNPIIRVYDIDGNLRYQSGLGSWEADGTVITGNSDVTAYLGNSNSSSITSTSVADATFMVNKKREVAQSSQISNVKDSYDALVYLKAVNYGRKYTVNFKVGSTTTTADSTAPKHVTTTLSNNGGDEINNDALKVSTIINELRDDLSDGVTASKSFDSMGSLDIQTPYDTNSNITAYKELSGFSSTITTGWTSTNIRVLVGGASVSYDASGANGWKFDGTKIVLPDSSVEVLQLPHYGSLSRYWKYRASVTVNRISSTTGETGERQIIPNTYAQEPFFIVSSEDDFDINVTDDDGGINLKAFKGIAKSFTDLPNQCVDGYRLGVVGDNQKKEDDFYVKYEGGAGSGFWRESTPYNSQNHLDNYTMPHTLRQNSDHSFTFGQGNWNERKAGDDNTNPFPSFVGSKITDIFFHRNRLGILAGENVIFSEASSYFNFFRTTVRTLLDSDPIDVAVSQNEVSELKAAVPIQDNLLLFSDLNQFTLSSDQLLTPAEVTIEQSTKYECDLTSTPVGSGTSVFFATRTGDYSGVREFITKDDTELKDALNITSHVPQYINGGIRKLEASPNEDMLLALTSVNKKECYVYKWHDSGQERLQSSWSKWTFKKDILDIFFTNAVIYFIFADSTMAKMDLTDDHETILLDNKILIGQWQPTANNLPHDYEAGASDGKVCVNIDGLSLGAYDHNNLTTAQQETLNSGQLYIGDPYTFKYQLSEQVFEPVKGDPTQLSRFQLRKISFNYNNTGHFDVTVDSVGRSPVISHFTGRVLDNQHNLLDKSAVIDDGAFQVGVQSQATNTAITITNDSHLPSIFQSAEWEGYIVLRNQRL